MVSINFRTTPDTSSTNELHRSRPTSASTGFLHSTSPHRWMKWTPLQRRNDLSESDVDVKSLGPTNATWDCQHLCEDLHACPVSRSCSRLYSVWSLRGESICLGTQAAEFLMGFFFGPRSVFSLPHCFGWWGFHLPLLPLEVEGALLFSASRLVYADILTLGLMKWVFSDCFLFFFHWMVTREKGSKKIANISAEVGGHFAIASFFFFFLRASTLKICFFFNIYIF